MANTQQLEDILKQEIEKLDEKIKQAGRVPLIQTIFDRLQGDFYNLITLSSSEMETLSNVFGFDIVTEAIKEVRFLQSYKGASNIKQQQQYKTAMSDLVDAYSYIKSYVEVDNKEGIKETLELRNEYQRLLKETNGNRINTNNISIPYVLEILEKLKLDINDENKILLNLITDLLIGKEQDDESADEQILSDDEQRILDLAEEILELHKEEIFDFVGGMQYSGYIEMIKQGLKDNIDDPEIKSKIELVELSNLFNNIKEWLELYKSIPSLYVDERQETLNEIENLIKSLKIFVVRNKKEEKAEDKFKLVFFEPAKDDFHSDSLKYPGYRNPMISILSELRHGNFNTEVRVMGTQRNLKRKRKFRLRVCYIPMSNNLILIFAINHREELGNAYKAAINRLNGNLKLIDFIIDQSKTEEGVNTLLQGSNDINKELDELIEARDKSIEGGSYAK